MQKLKKPLTVQFKTSRELKSLSDNSVLDGLYDARTNSLFLNADLRISAKTITLAHEFLHYANHKLFSLRATPILNNAIDVANFLIEKKNLKELIKARFGFKSLLSAIKTKISYIDYLNKLEFQIRQIKGNF